MNRSLRADVRNPLLSLPAMRQLRDLSFESQHALCSLLADISLDAAGKAEICWRKKKGPMAAYWKAVSVYAKHTGRAIRDMGEGAQARRGCGL